MNCPSRVDPIHTEGWNQNPDALNADATTRADLDHMANARLQRDHKLDPADGFAAEIEPSERHITKRDSKIKMKALDGQGNITVGEGKGPGAVTGSLSGSPVGNAGRATNDWRMALRGLSVKASKILRKYATFIGPGFMVAVAYIDPGRHFSGACFFNCASRYVTILIRADRFYLDHVPRSPSQEAKL